MGYLYLGIALLCGATKGYCGKKTSNFMRTESDSVTFNLIRMLFCILIGFFFVLPKGLDAFSVTPSVLLISALSGITSSGFIVTWMVAVRRGVYMIVDVFLTVGVMLPIVVCHFLYGEELTVKHLLGFALLLLAVYLMCSYNNRVGTKLTVGAFLLLCIVGLFNGTTDLLQKVFVHNQGTTSTATFNFYLYVFSALFLGLFRLYFYVREKKDNTKREKLPLRKATIYILVMAGCLFFHSYLKTLSAQLLPSVVIYPISQTGGMILSTFMAKFFFGERITPRCILGVTIALVALLLINVL